MTIIVFLALIPVMTGLVQRIYVLAGIDFAGYQSFLNSYHGLIQRLGAAVIFVPVGSVAYLLGRRTARPHVGRDFHAGDRTGRVPCLRART